MQAHDAFDPLWEAKVDRTGKSQKHCRGAGYKWLAERMGIPKAECHIGMFDVGQCQRVVEICRPYVARLAQARPA